MDITFPSEGKIVRSIRAEGARLITIKGDKMAKRYADGSKTHEEYISNLHKWQEEQLNNKVEVDMTAVDAENLKDKDNT